MIEIYCECGCGRKVNKGNRFINGHVNTRKKFSEEHKEKIRKAITGKKRTAETIRKMSISQIGHLTSLEARKKISRKSRITGNWVVLSSHQKLKENECFFGCIEVHQYCIHHEPKIEDILTWEGRLINLCRSCHQKVHHGSLELPPNSGIEWTIEQTNKCLGVS